MKSVILSTAIKFLCPLLGFYSVYILLRGHNEPGGGFIGGLMLALAVILWLLKTEKVALRERVSRLFPIALGGLILFLLCVVIFPTLVQQPVLKGLWTSIWLPLAGKFSSILLFDVGIYFVVSLSAVFSYVVLSSYLKENL